MNIGIIGSGKETVVLPTPPFEIKISHPYFERVVRERHRRL
jgi:hypothetical protein